VLNLIQPVTSEKPNPTLDSDKEINVYTWVQCW